MSKRWRKQYAGVAVLDDGPRGIVLAYGTTVPSDTALGYAPGCLFIDTNASAGSQLYINEGTAASADFNAALPPVGSLAGLTASVAELNITDGVLATADEINRAADVSTRVVNVTASSLALTVASHDGKLVTINAAAGCAITLPAATGTGAKFRLFIGTTITSNTSTITRAGSDTMFGMIYQLADGGATLAAYECPGSTVITLDGSTKGGIKGDLFELEDMATAIWLIIGHTSATGSEATPVT